MFLLTFNSIQLNVSSASPSGNMLTENIMYETVPELSTSAYQASEQPSAYRIHRELSTSRHNTSLPSFPNSE